MTCLHCPAEIEPDAVVCSACVGLNDDIENLRIKIQERIFGHYQRPDASFKIESGDVERAVEALRKKMVDTLSTKMPREWAEIAVYGKWRE